MECLCQVSNTFLQLWSGSVVAIHVQVWVLWVWQGVVFSNLPFEVGPVIIYLRHDRDVPAWSWIPYFNVFGEPKIIPNFDEFVHDTVIDLGINEGEITSEWFEEVVGPFLVEILDYILIEPFHQFIEFVALVVFIKNHWNIHIVVHISPESRWPAVVAKDFILVHCDSKYVFRLSKVLFMRPPYGSLSLILTHVLLFFAIHSWEEHGVKANISGKSCVPCALAKHINLPADLWM